MAVSIILLAKTQLTIFYILRRQYFHLFCRVELQMPVHLASFKEGFLWNALGRRGRWQLLGNFLHDNRIYFFGKLVIVNEPIDKSWDVVALSNNEGGILSTKSDVDIDGR